MLGRGRSMPGAVSSRSRAGILLDRDGTIIVDRGYVGSVEQVEFIEGSAEAIAKFNQAGAQPRSHRLVGRGRPAGEDIGLAEAFGASAVYPGPDGCQRPGVWSFPSLAAAAPFILERIVT